jgi:agmatine deiminase
MFPAEWTPHEACWLAFPKDPDLWEGELEAVRKEWVDLVRCIADPDPGSGVSRGERLEILVDEEDLKAAEAALRGLQARFHILPYGDIWLRDTGLVFVRPAGQVHGIDFRFDGWGQKYIYRHDAEVAAVMTNTLSCPTIDSHLTIEGGALETDGEGTLLINRDCIIDEVRNPGVDASEILTQLKDLLGVEKVLMIEGSLKKDHTDGHIDTLARFVTPAKVLVMAPAGADDPNREVLEKIQLALRGQTDARGRPIEVVTLPSPGRVEDASGELLPASYLNFYIGNRTVAVPTYGSPQDGDAVAVIARHFPDRRVEGLSARAILIGGGAFHCITCHQPAEVSTQEASDPS